MNSLQDLLSHVATIRRKNAEFMDATAVKTAGPGVVMPMHLSSLIFLG